MGVKKLHYKAMSRGSLEAVEGRRSFNILFYALQFLSYWCNKMMHFKILIIVSPCVVLVFLTVLL